MARFIRIFGLVASSLRGFPAKTRRWPASGQGGID